MLSARLLLIKAAFRGAASCTTTTLAPKRLHAESALDAFLSPSGAVLVPSFGALPFPTFGGVRSRIERNCERPNLLMLPRRSHSTSASGPPSGTEAKAPAATVNPSAEDDRALIDRLPELLRKPFEFTWKSTGLRLYLLKELSEYDDFNDNNLTAMKLELSIFKDVVPENIESRCADRLVDIPNDYSNQATTREMARSMIGWIQQWRKEQDDTFLSVRFAPGGMPAVPEFPIRRRAVEDKCLNLLQLSIQGLQYPSRGRFPLWDLGDAISLPDHDPQRSLLAPRLVARAELGTSIEIARSDAGFRAAEPKFNTRTVLSRIFATHRAKNNLQDDEVALLFIHVDEAQLAREALVLELQRNAREDFIKNSTRTKEQVESFVTSPAAIADFKLKASARFKTEVASLLNYNFFGPSQPNLVVLLFTGTGDAGVRFQPNQNGIMPLDLEPLSQEDSLAFVQRSARSTTPWHSDWFQDTAFQHLVADLGGSPQLLAALVASRPMQLSRPPGAPADKNKVLFEVALSFLQTESVIKHNRDLSSSVALRMLWLTMTHTYVPPNYVMNPTTGETVQDLAETGGATLVQKVADHVGLRVPIVLLRPILAKIPVAEQSINDDERPLLILLQAKDEDLPKKGDASNRTAKLFKAYSAIRNSTFGSKFDIVLCVVTSTTLTMSCRNAWQTGFRNAAMLPAKDELKPAVPLTKHKSRGTVGAAAANVQVPPLWTLDPNDAAPLTSMFRHATVVSDETSACE
ncbi:hypothetical protein CAOG_009390 [Capsaspora owczarzaki ATCC 30864]|uniref:Uncharacterized protein n=1 Tax=Capsaspora owczarzaki (strain ATCC 30864) TaxID=595528 RepID=A0A0D2WIQ3_CAPO3|nr:hypothetical protein CAOG_009390 [Capsaspora owczarzaki ATCC 30864]